MIFKSEVHGHLGPCKPTWINRNAVCNRLDGGVTGFFRNTRKWLGINWKTGPEFHGIIKRNTVRTTEGMICEECGCNFEPQSSEQLCCSYACTVDSQP